MMRVRKFFTAVLVSLSLVLAVLGTYASLLSGLPKVVPYCTLVLWFVATVVMLRVSLSGASLWRMLLPVGWLLMTYGLYGLESQAARQIYIETQGYPRRYYSWDMDK